MCEREQCVNVLSVYMRRVVAVNVSGRTICVCVDAALSSLLSSIIFIDV